MKSSIYCFPMSTLLLKRGGVGKKLLIAFAFLLFCLYYNGFAQLNYPFPNKDGEWYVLKWTPEPEYNFVFMSHVEKDTLINDKVYSILELCEDGIRCALRSDSIKVYAVNINDLKGNDYVSINTNEYVLYDYSLKVGDYFEMINYDDRSWIPIDTVVFEVLKVDSINIKGQYRKQLHLGGGKGNSQYWIEGIGSTISPIYQACLTEFEQGFDLNCYREKGKNIYGYYCEPDYVRTIENPIKANYNAYEKTLQLKVDGCLPVTVDIFDSMGRLVCSSSESPQSQLDLSFLSKGCFIIHLLCGKNSYSQKIIINK